MAENELLIKIGADITEISKKFEELTEKTEHIESNLTKVAKVSAVAFAALTAEVGASVYAYGEEEKAINRLTAALHSQGIFSNELVEDYEKQAQAIQNLTGDSHNSVIAAQTTIQAFIGQRAVTEDLTLAIANLSAQQRISLEAAAELIGHGITGHARALKLLDIQVDETKSKQEKLTQVIQEINSQFNGAAAAAGKGTGALRILKESFGDLEESIGKQFAPVVSRAAKALSEFIDSISHNEKLITFVAGLLAAGVVVTGLVTLISTLGAAFSAAGALAAAFGVSMAALLGPVAIAGIVAAAVAAAIGTYALNTIKAKDKTKELNDEIARLNKSVDDLGGTLKKYEERGDNINADKIKKLIDARKAALDDAKESLRKLESQARSKEDNSPEALKAKSEAEAARRRNEIKEEQLRREQAVDRASRELSLLQAQQASQELIALKQKEVGDLKLVADEKFKGDKDALLEHAESLRALEQEQASLDVAQKAAFNDEILAQNADYQKLTEEQKQLFVAQNGQALQQQVLTEQTVRAEAAKQRATDQIKTNNTFLLEQQKFGTAYAAINRAMHSEIYLGSKQAFGELAQLQQSSNSTLKAIGKVAAIANIVIKTAESAMNIYAGFSTIPIIGPALGVAGAAAAIAFGAEQLGTVTAAATGGLVEGGIPGKDSVLHMLEPGELVVPKKNFNSVVESYNGGGADSEAVVAALGRIESKIGSGSTTVIQGDVMADDSYIDALVRKISDAVQYRNGQIVGVNA